MEGKGKRFRIGKRPSYAGPGCREACDAIMEDRLPCAKLADLHAKGEIRRMERDCREKSGAAKGSLRLINRRSSRQHLV
ncbi:hypothetical protein IP76_15545 [Rhizobium sp. AAP43]|nr:hypothetical protein IP76_15545 [Rhizobium sp. AAP43]